MTTIFSLLVQSCGLSHREAASFLDVRLDTIRSWSNGRNPTPAGVLNQMILLANQIETANQENLKVLKKQISAAKKAGAKFDPIELGLAADDAEAQDLGWPCVGAQKAAFARIIISGMNLGLEFKIVPRGSTIASAATADIHDKGR